MQSPFCELWNRLEIVQTLEFYGNIPIGNSTCHEWFVKFEKGEFDMLIDL